MNIKQTLLDMGLNIWGLDLFVESYLSQTKFLLAQKKVTLKDAKLDFQLVVRDRGDRNGKVRVTIERIEE